MATITISSALVADITDSLTYRTSAESTWEYTEGYGQNFVNLATSKQTGANTGAGGSLLGAYGARYAGLTYFYLVDGIINYGENVNANAYVRFDFRNAAGTTLISYKAAEIVSRTIDANGYCVLSNFPEKTPSVAGTIDYILIHNNSQDLFARTITLSVGAAASGSDVEFADRTLVTSQPWRLDGTIKFRAPTSYTFST
jgi:hypothetical protein